MWGETVLCSICLVPGEGAHCNWVGPQNWSEHNGGEYKQDPRPCQESNLGHPAHSQSRVPEYVIEEARAQMNLEPVVRKKWRLGEGG